MGKAANYVLRDLPNVVSVSIQAPYEHCVKEIMERSAMTEAEAARAIRRTDRYRADYHRYYTGEKWRDAIHYDLSLNSARLDRKTCVEVIKQCVASKVGVDFSKQD